jgi:CheY-like chemotaxis protein
MTEIDILLVEDNRVDAQLIAEALKDANFLYHLEIVSDGEAAIQHLRTREFNPDLVLLDLNLPKVTGIEVLQTIKQDPYLRVIPVIILSNSTAPTDVAACYAAHANAYIRKPLGFDGLAAVLGVTGQFWFQTAVLPGNVLKQRVSSLPPTSQRRRLRKKK